MSIDKARDIFLDLHGETWTFDVDKDQARCLVCGGIGMAYVFIVHDGGCLGGRLGKSIEEVFGVEPDTHEPKED